MSGDAHALAQRVVGHAIPAGTAKAMADVFDERFAQIAHGYTADHDDAHGKGEIVSAALHYAVCAFASAGGLTGVLSAVVRVDVLGIHAPWPFERAAWKPGSPRRMLVKAVALLLAEIERLDRVAARDGR